MYYGRFPNGECSNFYTKNKVSKLQRQREYFRTCINLERYELNLLVSLINITEGRYIKVTEERE